MSRRARGRFAARALQVVSAICVALACGNADREDAEQTAQLHAALSSNDRVFMFEGAIGGASGPDWQAGSGTTVSASSTRSEGVQSLSLSGSQSPSAVSAALSTLGPVGSKATLDVMVPASLAGQSWLGQVALSINAPSVGVYSQYAGPTPLSGPVGEFRRYEIALPANVVTALSTGSYTDLTVTIQLNVPSTAAFLVDKLSFGQAAGTGGGGGSSNGGGGTGNAGGVSGTSGTSGTAGSGASSGGGGSSGSAGSTSSNGEKVRFAFKLPAGIAASEIAMGTTGGSLSINDGADLLGLNGGLASISSVENSGLVNRIGVSADVKNAWSEGPLFVASRGIVHGFAKSAQTVTLQDATSQVLGGITNNTDLRPLQEEAWEITFPQTTQGDVSLEPNTERTLAAGTWGALSVKQNARLKLSPGLHTFTSIVIDSGGVIDVSNFAPVYVYSRNGFIFRGTIQRSQSTPNILFGIAGAAPIAIDSSFRGILVAPDAAVSLITTPLGHFGTVFAKQIVQHQSTNFFHEPFDRAALCTAGAECTSLCPCKDTGAECTSDSECGAGMVCWLENGRRFDLPSGSGACADPRCATDPIGVGCGSATAPCGRCDNSPRSCSQGCVAGDVCGIDNGARFDGGSIDDKCWSSVCETAANTAPNCGTTDAPCGTCDCSSNCAGKTCGDDPSDGCGGICPGICQPLDLGCTSDLDCSGSICGIGVGDRFGFTNGNVCWSFLCSKQDPTQPNCGVPEGVDCGECPPCVPQCEAGSTGPDGCGGVCGTCESGQIRALGRFCLTPSNSRSDSGPEHPVPILDAGPTETVGAIPANFSVTDRGTVAYSIPIEVPPGRRGMQPGLSLMYSSTKSNGMLGMGWALGGLSSITRCDSILDREGSHRKVAFDSLDALCMDGQALVPIDPVPGGFEREYRTEIDSFSRIIAHGPEFAPSGERYIGPRYFEVFTKDGRILTYGRSDHASVYISSGDIKRTWALERVEDRTGNSVVVQYRVSSAPGTPRYSTPFEEGGDPVGQIRVNDFDASSEIVPDHIAYGNVTATFGQLSRPSYTRFVRFSYESRPDERRHYIAGAVGYSTERLTRIDTFVEDELVKSYLVDYESRSDEETRVHAIRECFTEANQLGCKPATIVEYFEQNAVGMPVNIFELPGQPLPPADIGALHPDVGAITLDVDGDGLDDILGYNKDLGHPEQRQLWILAKNRSPQGFDVTQSNGVQSSIVEGQAPSTQCLGPASVIDLNRDGKDDLLDRCSLSTGLTVYLSDGSKFHPHNLGFSMPAFVQHLADLNGDGLKDIVATADARSATSGDVRLRHTLRFAINNGTNFEPLPDVIEGRNSGSFLKVVDFDGDGTDELLQSFDLDGMRVFFFSTRRWVDVTAARYSTVRFIDANGDGLKDLIAHIPDRVLGADGVALLLNTGTRLEQQVIPHSLDLEEGQVFDFDGDGREDFVQSNGYFRYSEVGKLDFVPLDIGSTRGSLADVDGDGSIDLLRMPAPLTDGRLQYVLLGAAAQAGLLKRVTDGYGKQIDVSYAPFETIAEPGGQPSFRRVYSAGSCRSDNEAFSNTCIRRVAPLVAAHFESQVSGDRRKTGPAYRYRYFDARSGSRGRGFLGFAKRSITLANLWETTLTFRNESFFFAGRLSASEKRFLNDNPASAFSSSTSRTETSSYHWTSRASDHGQFPFIDSESHRVFEGAEFALTRTAIDRTVDRFGTVDSTETSVFAGTVPVTTTTVSVPEIENRVDDWILGLEKEVVTTGSRRGETRERRVRSDYDESGLVRVTEREPNSPASSLYQKTTIVRDAYGNITSTCVRDARGESHERCTDVLQFDEAFMFPRRIRDAAGLTSEFEYSARTGQPLVIADPNNAISEFAYDGLGRLKRAVTPTSDVKINYEHATPTATGFVPELLRWSVFAVRTDAKGEGVTTKYFDAFGALVGENAPGFDSQRVETEHEYDSLGRLARTTVPHLPGDTTQGFVRREYDNFGRLQQVNYPEGSIDRYFHPTRHSTRQDPWFTDAVATTATVIQKPRRNIEVAFADPYGNTVKTLQATDETGAETLSARYVYTAFDVLQEIHGPIGTTSIESDNWGRRTSLSDPALGIQSYTYTGFDEVETVTDAENLITKRSYDRLGRQTELLDGAGTLLAKWIYDGDGPNERGRLVAAYRQAKPNSSTGNWIRHRYQTVATGLNRGLLESTEFGIGGTPDNPDSGQRFALNYEYKQAVPWQLDILHYPAAAGHQFAVQHQYDASGALRMIHAPGILNPNLAYWRLLETDQGHRLKTERFGNGLISQREYYRPGCGVAADLSCMPGRVARIATKRENESSEPVHDWSFVYDRNGNLARRISNGLNPITQSYSYDGFDRLQFHDEAAGVTSTRLQALVYDNAGNISSKTGVGTYTYDPSRRFQVRAAGGVSYTYDAKGNQVERIENEPTGALIPGGYQRLDYNDFDMPWRITNGQGDSALPVELEYTAAGARVVKREFADAAGTVAKLTLDIAELYQQSSHFGLGTEIERRHHYRILAGGRQVAQVNKVERGGVINTEETKVYYVHDDPLGTTSAITDIQGTVVESREFLPFGEERSPVNWRATDVSNGFTGHQHDPELNLINMRGRLYDSRLSRFITPDPFVTEPLNPQGLNRYSYVQNNPLKFVDPSGFQACQGSNWTAACPFPVYGTVDEPAPPTSMSDQMNQAYLQSVQSGGHNGPSPWTNQHMGPSSHPNTQWLPALWSQPTISNPQERPFSLQLLYYTPETGPQPPLWNNPDYGWYNSFIPLEYQEPAPPSLNDPAIARAMMGLVPVVGSVMTVLDRRSSDSEKAVAVVIAAVEIATVGAGMVFTRSAGAAGAVALDTNALIAAVEGGQASAILGGRTPILSISATKEFLRGAGSSEALRGFLAQTNGRIGSAGQEATVAALQQQAASLGRVLHTGDARVVAGAMREGIPIATNDVRLGNFLRAIGYQTERF